MQGEGDKKDYVDYFSGIGVETHYYQDLRDGKEYIPSIKPYLWSEFLREDSTRQQETYLYIDSDVIFNRLPLLDKLPKLSSNYWYCSDTLGYTNYIYLNSVKYAEEILPRMCELADITPEQLREQSSGEGGAQWIIKNPTLEYWEDVYTLSNSFWKYFQTVHEKTDLDNLPGGIQTWCAEMYATTFSAIKHGIRMEVSDELSFAWTPDKHEINPRAVMIHDSGVQDNKEHFRKSDYLNREPYMDDFSKVDPDSWSANYVAEIKKTGINLHKI